ncbi:MAG: hypothetical protein LBK67_10040 [Coriobacteriales bacterium]|jgi:hypothetical protein|nr:hypothetical protein [Coriobacteriales bacterium]
MEIVIRNKDLEPVYAIRSTSRIRTLSGDICFEVFVWKPERRGSQGRTLPAGFITKRRYPTKLSDAFRRIAEDLMHDAGETVECTITAEGLRDHAKEIERLLDSFEVEVIEKLEIGNPICPYCGYILPDPATTGYQFTPNVEQ